MIGQTISHFTIREKLGEDATGVVWKAHDEKLERFVALRLLHPHLSRDDRDKQRFLVEARAASAVEHPNVCSVHSVGETSDGRLFLEMAFYDGETLDVRLARGPLSWPEAVEIARQLAAGLAKIHERGLVHGGLRSSNVKLSTGGQVKILDLGLGSLGAAERRKAPRGPNEGCHYLAPEQLSTGGDAAAAGPRSDLWVVGVLLYEMTSGRRPFEAADPDALAAAISAAEPAPLGALVAGLPPAIETTVRRALAKNPADRQPSAAALAAELAARPPRSETGLGGAEERRASVAARPVSGMPSVAVLPFANLTGDPDDEYFAEGLADELITALGQTPGLKVAARSSAFTFKGRNLDVREIGRQLGVATVLEGSVRRAGRRLRVTAQLIAVSGGHHLFSERYDREMGDVFALQDDLARAIVSRLESELLEKTAPLKRYTADLDAYHLYLKGRYFWNQRRRGSIQKSLACFLHAIAQDDGYSLAYSGLADAYSMLGVWGFQPAREMFPQARAAAQRALDLAPELAEPHASLGLVAMFFDRDARAAEGAFRSAIERGPRYAAAWSWYAVFLASCRRFEAASEKMSRARELDPLARTILCGEGIVLYLARRHEAAKTRLARSLELDPEFFPALLFTGLNALALGQIEPALESFEQATSGAGSALALGYLGLALGVDARPGPARSARARLEEMAAMSHVSPFEQAMSALGTGAVAEAFTLLEQAVHEHVGPLVFLDVLPALDPWREHPSWPGLIAQIGWGRA